MTNNRDGLTGAELNILETQVLPTARRWLREYPGLAEQAVKTLTYWGEPLVDDRGRAYDPMHERTARSRMAAE
jgi:hypothetical protein